MINQSKNTSSYTNQSRNTDSWKNYVKLGSTELSDVANRNLNDIATVDGRKFKDLTVDELTKSITYTNKTKH